MRKYPNVIVAMMIIISSLFLITIKPRLSQPELSVAKDSGQIDLPENFYLGIEFTDAEEVSGYYYNAMVSFDKSAWTKEGIKWIENEHTNFKLPLGKRADVISGMRLSNQRVFNYEHNDRGEMKLYISDLKDGSVITSQYQVKKPDYYYTSTSYAEVDEKLYLLMFAQPNNYNVKTEYYRLVINLDDGQVIDEAKVSLPEIIQGQGLRGSDPSRVLAPNKWNMTIYTPRESVNSEYYPEDVSIYLIDPVSLDYEIVDANDNFVPEISYQIKDIIFIVTQESNGLTLGAYKIADESYQVITKVNYLSPSKGSFGWNLKLAEDYVSLNYIDENNQARILMFATEKFEEIYRGHVEVDSDKLQAVSVY